MTPLPGSSPRRWTLHVTDLEAEGVSLNAIVSGPRIGINDPVVQVVEMTDRDDTESVWVLWAMDDGPEFIGVYGSRAGADAAQVSRGIGEFHIHREEIRREEIR